MAARSVWAAALLTAAVGLGGCLGKPPVEDRWTRVDLVAWTPLARQVFLSDTSTTLHVQATVTYRAVLTGFAVAELRVADSLASSVVIQPDAPRVAMAGDIDALLLHSRPLGRATRAVTGWDHLVQPLDFSFRAATPPDSLVGSTRLFVLCYLGSGTRLELPSGADSIVITPFISSQQHVLPVGLELFLARAVTP